MFSVLLVSFRDGDMVFFMFITHFKLSWNSIYGINYDDETDIANGKHQVRTFAQVQTRALEMDLMLYRSGPMEYLGYRLPI